MEDENGDEIPNPMTAGEFAAGSLLAFVREVVGVANIVEAQADAAEDALAENESMRSNIATSWTPSI